MRDVFSSVHLDEVRAEVLRDLLVVVWPVAVRGDAAPANPSRADEGRRANTVRTPRVVVEAKTGRYACVRGRVEWSGNAWQAQSGYQGKSRRAGAQRYRGTQASRQADADGKGSTAAGTGTDANVSDRPTRNTHSDTANVDTYYLRTLIPASSFWRNRSVCGRTRQTRVSDRTPATIRTPHGEADAPCSA